MDQDKKDAGRLMLGCETLEGRLGTMGDLTLEMCRAMLAVKPMVGAVSELREIVMELVDFCLKATEAQRRILDAAATSHEDLSARMLKLTEIMKAAADESLGVRDAQGRLKEVQQALTTTTAQVFDIVENHRLAKRSLSIIGTALQELSRPADPVARRARLEAMLAGNDRPKDSK